MLKLDTKHFKPIQIEIDGTVYTLKKITARVVTRGLEIAEAIQKEGVGIREATDLMAEFLMLYLPVDRDWVLDNLDMDDCRNVMNGINVEVSQAMGAAEPPLASGPGGDNSQK